MSGRIAFRALILPISLGVLATAGQAQVQFSLGNNEIKFVKEMTEGSSAVTRFVIQGSSQDEWTQALEIVESPKKGFPRTAPEAFERLKAQRAETCRSSTYEVLAQSEKSMLWETRSAECQGAPAQHAITRLAYGKSRVAFLIFTVVGEMTPEQRTEWIGLLSEASVK